MARIERVTERRESILVNRRRVRTPRTTREVAYVITSLYPEEATEADLLTITRDHWTVEALHHMRDVTYGEDQSQARTGTGPRAMAALRNLAIGLVRGWGFRYTTDAHRYFPHHVDELFSRLAVG